MVKIAHPVRLTAPGKTTLVEFFLAAEQDAVTVTVVESGFAALDAPEEVREAGMRDNTGGWAEELAGLRKRAEWSYWRRPASSARSC